MRTTSGSPPTTGYETLLYDAINADATLFQRADSVEGVGRHPAAPGPVADPPGG